MKLPLLIIALFMSVLSNRGTAQLGQLDTSFGTQGLISNEVYATPVLLSGIFTTSDKIYSVLQAVNVAEPATYVRAYNLDGSIYTNFGVNGTLTIAAFAGYDAAYNAAQNKIYFCGQTSIGEDGFIDLDLNTESYALHTYSVEAEYGDIMYFIRLTDNNEVILSGFHININTNLGALRIVKFDSNLMLDDSFGINGKVTLPELAGTNGSNYGIHDMEIDNDGNILLLGSIDVERKILKLSNSGEIDNTFFQASELASYIAFNDLTMTPEGKLMVIPSIYNLQNVIRLNSDGTLDTTFANQGTFVLESTNPDYLIYLKNGLIDDDGNFIVIGSYVSYTTGNFEGKTLFKLDTNGAIDPQFQPINNDIGYTCGYNASFSTSRVAFQPDGKILSIDFSTCYDTETTVHQENLITRFTNETIIAVEEVETSTLLTYPNPAQHNICLVRNGKSLQSSKISIYDAFGKLVLSDVMKSETISVENLSPGFYTIQITDNNNMSVAHFVKE